jgi:hypothetical protein
MECKTIQLIAYQNLPELLNKIGYQSQNRLPELLNSFAYQNLSSVVGSRLSSPHRLSAVGRRLSAGAEPNRDSRQRWRRGAQKSRVEKSR